MKKKFAKLLALTLVAGTVFAGCGAKKDSKEIVIGATPSPHAEILGIAKEELEK